jgi:hypothetical protein
MEEVSNEVKLGIISIKLKQWNNTLYDVSLDERVGRVTHNEDLIKNSSDRMKIAMMAIDELEKIRAELETLIEKGK